MKESSDSQAVITHLYDGLEQSIVDIITSCAEIGYSVRSNGGMLTFYMNEYKVLKASINSKIEINRKDKSIKIHK